MAIFRSHQNIYAQIIDDTAGKTLVAASSRDQALRQDLRYGGNKTAAAAVGKALAQRALEAGVQEVVFDRREYKFHGRVAALAAGRPRGRIEVLDFRKQQTQRAGHLWQPNQILHAAS